MSAISRRTETVAGVLGDLAKFFTDSPWARRHALEGACDFAFGNPQELPLRGFVEALVRQAEPRDKDWFAYKGNEPATCTVIAQSLADKLALPFEAEDIGVTNGAFAAMVVALHLVADPGDEIVFSLPPWFCYEPLILNAGCVPVKCPILCPGFDLDLEGLARAITPRTRIVIVNTPHNPTGRVYAPETLRRLADMLTQASARHGRPIYLLSDEAYREIVFSGVRFHSPAAFYPHTLIAYSYAKKLLTPGQRIGYLAISPACPDRRALREALFHAKNACGWCFANALLQHAIEDLERLSIDIGRLEGKRDRMVGVLRDIGYDATLPEGTFYLLVRAPQPDDLAFAAWLAERDVFIMPGTVFALPGYVRISLTATEDMIERSLPIFAAAFEAFRSGGTAAAR